MNKKFFLLLLLLITFLLPSKAVLKEDSLNNSLSVLRHELITYHYEQDEMLKIPNEWAKKSSRPCVTL